MHNAKHIAKSANKLTKLPNNKNEKIKQEEKIIKRTKKNSNTQKAEL